MKRAAAVALILWVSCAAFAAEDGRPQLLEFIKKFRVTAFSNASCTGFNGPSDRNKVYGMFVNIDVDSPGATEERKGIVSMAMPCPNEVVRVGLLSWPKDLLGGSYLAAVQLEEDVVPRSIPKFRVLGVAGTAAADEGLEEAFFDLASRK